MMLWISKKFNSYEIRNPGRIAIIMNIEEMEHMKDESFSRKISFLRAGWWIIHLLGISAVYTLGHLLWR